ncbi:MAG: restriction endonuclease subunit S [Ignavibacteriales bacterium]|nr:restriction endonuclease subunit S [Ignavibacteriales bacterium]
MAQTFGVNYPRTSFDALSRFKFALPNPTEQKSIGNVLFKLEDKIITHNCYRNQLRDIFSSMLNQLMTGQIRVIDIEFKEVEKVR